MVPKDLPKIAPVTEKERDVDDAIAALEARIAALEELPHTIKAEYHEVDAVVGAAAVMVEVQHSLGILPRGGVLLGAGVQGGGIETDVVLTLEVDESTNKTARLWLQRTVGAAATTRRYYFLLF